MKTNEELQNWLEPETKVRFKISINSSFVSDVTPQISKQLWKLLVRSFKENSHKNRIQESFSNPAASFQVLKNSIWVRFVLDLRSF